MAGGALKAAFSLLLFASIVQGLRDVDLFHNETVEAVVGQNVSLPCIVKNLAKVKVVNTEWSKRENEIMKLALYTPGFGVYWFRSNVSIQPVYNDAKIFMGTYLQLHEVEKGNSGIYVCDVTTFPFGSVKAETELKIKDVADSSVTSQTTELPPTDTSVTWTTDVGSDVTRYDMRSEESSTLGSRTANSSTPGATTTLSTGNTTKATEYNGLRDVDLLHNETVEAVVGQNVSLPCIVTNIAKVKVVNTEWSKRENKIRKLALYTPGFGVYRFRSNVSIQPVFSDAKIFMGTYLQLHEVEKGNSGIYVCEVTTFPFSSVRAETELKIKDVADSSVTSQTTELPPTDTSVTWTTDVGSDVMRYDMRSEESSTLGSSTANSSTPGATTTLSAGNTAEATGYNGSLRTYRLLVFIIVLSLISVAVCLYRRRIRRERTGVMI
ncbi:uncharacterized protein LOC128381859 [Scomber scombrus]|uniref:Uncharacterized protein LOC128381859 n=1 Tax=Scomber scombrus TaxID=13677 RepID=A0AAV1QGT2_SCOSC